MIDEPANVMTSVKGVNFSSIRAGWDIPHTNFAVFGTLSVEVVYRGNVNVLEYFFSGIVHPLLTLTTVPVEVFLYTVRVLFSYNSVLVL